MNCKDERSLLIINLIIKNLILHFIRLAQNGKEQIALCVAVYLWVRQCAPRKLVQKLNAVGMITSSSNQRAPVVPSVVSHFVVDY